ncbi:alpha/beta hydrolase [Simkania sp.]|uniref:alpha/beta hydrolase n=1 Tax=Simkania sp. TaxID=34094 RepID=UPI003B5223A4
MKVSQVKVSDSLTFSFVGPSLEEGPLPTIFYFALSAKDSLETDPYNQPALFLQSDKWRIFTVTLPGHEEGRKPENAISYWAEQMKQGNELLTPFFQEVAQGIQYLLQENLIQKDQFGCMGLSRGVFIAAHVAALCPELRFILGFAPLTRLSYAKEFQNGPDVSHFDLEKLAFKLYDRKIRFYIGNIDSRVGTKYTFELVSHLAEEAKNHRIRSSPIELIIGPSIGYQGHGTGPQVFQAGTLWVRSLLEGSS